MGFWLTFFMWAASFLLTDYFRPKLPSQEPSGEGDFQSPTSTEGRKIPQVVGGTVKVKGPNTLWRGDWEAVPVTVETGVVFKRDETVGYQYRIALALGQFYGRAAGMTAIYIGDDKVWDYVADNGSTPATVADVDLPDLWGGETKGGGFVGRFTAFTGQGNTVSSFLASRVTNQSRWPGMIYVVLTNLTETGGANIGEVNQLRDIRIEWQTFDTIANGGLGNELSLTGNRHIIGRDANPISCAYRVLSDPQWSVSLGDINFANFQDVANTCFDEGIGFSMLVDSEQDAYEILSVIEKHIDGYFGPNPANGLMEVTLARSGYDPLLEYQADTSNILQIINYAKSEWPQTKNEVKVRFVNRDKDYTDDHAVAQDMAGRLIAGRPQSTTLRYPGVRTAEAANAIVARTARAYFWPLAKFEMELDRSAWDLRPGSVAIVTHPDINATDLPCRVTRIRLGDPIKQTIKADVVEDVFAYETGIQAQPQPSGDVPPTFAPVAVTNHINTIVPRWMHEFYEQPFEPRVIFLVGRDNPNSGWFYDYRCRASVGGGNFDGFAGTSLAGFVSTGTLRAAVPHVVSTNNNGGASTANGGGMLVDGDLGSVVGSYTPLSNYTGLAVINPRGANEEFVAFTAAAVNGGGIECTGLYRGIGTSPISAHEAGERVWFLDKGVYMQPLAYQNDLDFSLSYRIGGIAQGVQGTISGYTGEVWVRDTGYTEPYPPTGVIFTNISSNWFAPGDAEASGPGGNLSSPSAGIPIQVLNRRFDQNNAIYGANSVDDNSNAYPTNAFSDVNPTLNWFVYDLDTHPNPVRGNQILSGTLVSDDRVNGFTITQAQVEALGLSNPSPINARFEFTWQNGTTLAEVPSGVESPSVFFDKAITYLPAQDSYDAMAATVLLLHFEGFDGTTQVFDWSTYDHTVALAGDAEIDTGAGSDAGLGVGSMVIDGTGDWANVADDPAFNLDCDAGFVIQARIYLKSTPTGEIPIVTKWATTGNQRSFWFGLSGTALRLRISTDGTNDLVETTGTRSWSLNTWYEIAVVVFNHPGDPQTLAYFFVNGVFDEREDFAAQYTGLFDSTAPVRIGADADDNAAPAMNIDEVRIIDQAIYLAPWTLLETEYPGRERQKVLHLNWEDGADGDLVYNSDDLNELPISFPSGGGSQVDDAQAKFGTKSLYCAGLNVQTFNSSSGVLVPDTQWTGTYEQWFDFGVRDFTMECFVRFESLPTTQGTSALITKWKRGGSPNAVGSEQFNRRNWDFLFGSDNALQFAYNINNAQVTLNTGPIAGIAINTWYHCAVVRKNGVLSIYFDGNRVGQDLTGFDGLWIRNHNAAGIALGRLYGNSNSTTWALKGWLDEVRILNGVAEYDGATYTVPTAAFPTDPDPEPAPIIPEETGSNWQPTNL